MATKTRRERGQLSGEQRIIQADAAPRFAVSPCACCRPLENGAERLPPCPNAAAFSRLGLQAAIDEAGAKQVGDVVTGFGGWCGTSRMVVGFRPLACSHFAHLAE